MSKKEGNHGGHNFTEDFVQFIEHETGAELADLIGWRISSCGDIIEKYAEQEHRKKVNAISDEDIEKQPFSEHGKQECDEEYYGWLDGAKWFKEKLLKQ